MTPDQQFARWIRLSLITFAFLFVYFIIADLWMPMTPQSRVLHHVVRITPHVSGQVMQVHVSDNTHVEAGSLLFTLDQKPYQLEVEEAELTLEEAVRQNDQLDASIAAAEADIGAAQADADELAIELKRVTRLLKSHTVSQQAFDQTKANYDAAQANVKAAEANTYKLKVERGQKNNENLRLRQARNNLNLAHLNLSYTQVRADVSGIVSNLQVIPGTYANAGSPIAALVTDKAYIIADFREKSLSNVLVDTKAEVTFDSIPGKVFEGRVKTLNAGVKDGQLIADGELAYTEESDRWVRNAQRLRLHVALDENPELLRKLPSGARTTVQLYPVSGPAAWLGALQIRLVSMMHYIY